jgi:NADH dehydrogenase [ubiquinone] 1 alpha subcomplex assembly factor 5
MTIFRHSLHVAEDRLRGGVGVHASPLVGAGDAGNLLSRAQFALPAGSTTRIPPPPHPCPLLLLPPPSRLTLQVDVDTLTVGYPSLRDLLAHLRAMGEQSAATLGANFLRRDVLALASEIYKNEFPNEGGGVTATFQVIYLAGWAPHGSQPRPKARGSHELSLRELGGVVGELRE